MLTQFSIQKAQPKEKPYKLSDGGGLHLLIEPSGSRLWRFRYQFERKEKMLSLGVFPLVSLAEARARRDNARKLVAAGTDPSKTAWNNVGKLILFEAIGDKPEGYVLELAMFPDTKFGVFEDRPRGEVASKIAD